MAESLQNIKSRLHAVKNTGQITKAMEVVSATKMRKSQEAALKSRPYAYSALDLLRKVSEKAGSAKNFKIPFTEARDVKNTLVILVSSDRGLAGSFNAQVARATDKLLASDPFARDAEHEFLFAAVGKKSESYIQKNKFKLEEKFYGFGDFIDPAKTVSLAEFIMNGFNKHRYDRVLAVSTHFRTALFQEVLVRQILPLNVEKIAATVREIVPEHGKFANLEAELPNGSSASGAREIEYIMEPEPQEVLDAIVPHLVKMQVYHLVLEANASEHSARRVAMKNASDSADEIGDELTIAYNKARQASITGEMIEIISTQNAL